MWRKLGVWLLRAVIKQVVAEITKKAEESAEESQFPQDPQ